MPRPGRALRAAFFARPTLVVARELLGAVLVHETAEGRTAGRIVEVEAYVGESDPGCHAASGRTPRNAPLYGPPGVAYVYLNYGVHSLVNAVTEAEGQPAAVLIRALEPLEGHALMRRRRGADESVTAHELCRGPGRLTRALGITLAANQHVLGEAPLSIEAGTASAEVVWTRRIGLSRGGDRYWRGVVPGHPALSGTRAWNADARPRPWPERATADVR